MSCDLEALESYALGELSEARAEAVAAHAQACPACGQELRALRQERAALAARARLLEEPPPPFEAALARSLAPVSGATPPGAPARRRPAWAAGLSAIAAPLLLALGPGLRPRPAAPGQAQACVSWSAPPEALAVNWADEAIATEEHTYAACLVATPGLEHPLNACL